MQGQALDPRILRGGGLPSSSDALKRQQQQQNRDEVRRICAETGVTAITAQRLLAEEKVAVVFATTQQPSKQYQDHKSAEWIQAYFEV